jgi:hypothetical protein
MSARLGMWSSEAATWDLPPEAGDMPPCNLRQHARQADPVYRMAPGRLASPGRLARSTNTHVTSILLISEPFLFC